MKVPFLDLNSQYKNIKKEVDTSVSEVISSGMFIMGDQVREFENKMEDYLETTNCVSCANGSDALFMALKTMGIKNGDEVITTPFTFFATAGAIVRAGGTPVFVDIIEDTYNINPDLIEEKITNNTKAILPVHIYGQPADMDKINKIAKKYDLYVLEDACQAIGADYKNKKAGSLADFSAFSFFPTKNLGAYGDGGMVCAKDKKHYEHLKSMRVHGSQKKYYHDFVGINSRLDALQAAVLNIKFQYLEEWNNKRRDLAKEYNKKLQNFVKVPMEKEDVKHVYHLYSLQTEKRDELQEYLKENNIDTGVYYPLPLHLQKCFENLGYKKGDLPISEKVSKEIISIPIFAEVTDDQVEYMLNTVVSFFKQS